MPVKKNKNLSTNLVLQGDCLKLLKTTPSESIDLIYLDPPFFTQKNHNLKNKSGNKSYGFSDKWLSRDEYIQYLALRLFECKRVLKNTGSLFLHCDKTASHYLKICLDQVFGFENFQSEIIWSYRRWSNSKKGLLNNHQVILFFSKSENFKFNKIYDEYSPTTNVEQIVQLRARDSRNKTVYKLDKSGKPVLSHQKKGVPLGDVWEIPFLNPKANERVNYPTQKPILLLEKIIKLVTQPGDMVLDPFCGSGTTLVAAQLLNRKFIGFDLNKKAISLAKKRLQVPIKTESQLLQKGKSAYLKQSTELVDKINNMGAIPVQRNKGIDCLISSHQNIIPIKIVKDYNKLEESAALIAKSSQKNKYKFKGLFVEAIISLNEVKKIENKYNVIIFKNKNELLKKVKKSKL